MMRDAGVDVNGIMLYEADEPMFRGLVSHWSKYTRRDQLNLVVGNQVDWYLHQKTLDPSGPESYIDRILRGAANFHTDGKPVRGVFIHDIHRLLVVNGKRKGPYGTFEWMLAAGHAVTETRRLNGALPFDATLELPASTVPGKEMTAVVSLRGEIPEGPVTLRFFGAPDLAGVPEGDVVLSREKPSVAFTIRWTPVAPLSEQRGNRTFLAFRAAGKGCPENRPVIQTRYVQGMKPASPVIEDATPVQGPASPQPAEEAEEQPEPAP
jgi:hypothetical protein